MSAETRLRGLSLGALLLASVLGLALVGLDGASLLGVALPAWAILALATLPVGLGVAASVRRSGPLAFAAAAALTLPGLAASAWEASAGDIVLAALWALAILTYAEVAHMASRYAGLSAASERSGTTRESLDRAIEEYLKTLGATLGLTALLAGALLGLYAALRAFGPAQYREAVEIASPHGVVLVAGLFAILFALAVIARGADFTWIKRARRETPASASPESAPPAASQGSRAQEVDIDALE